MVMPRPDESAYDGNLIVRRTTYRKAVRTESDMANVDRAKKVLDNLNKAIANRLTFDSIDFTKDNVEDQMRINKGVADELRKEAIKLKSFIANNLTPSN